MTLSTLTTLGTSVIEEGFHVDIIGFCLTGITIMATAIAIVKTVEQFSKIFKKPVWWIKQNNVDHEELLAIKTQLDEHIKAEEKRIQQLSSADAEIKKTISDLNKAMNDLTHMFVDKQISDMRFTILDVASSITLDRKYSTEQLAYVLKIYDDYVRILHERNLTNGHVDMSIEIIRDEYRRMTHI